jgi:hypothetical protein
MDKIIRLSREFGNSEAGRCRAERVDAIATVRAFKQEFGTDPAAAELFGAWE